MRNLIGHAPLPGRRGRIPVPDTLHRGLHGEAGRSPAGWAQAPPDWQQLTPTPGWPPSGPGLSVTRASGLRPALQCRQPLQLTSLREGPPSAQSFAGHQTGAACLEGPRPAERIFNGTNLVHFT